MLPSVSCFDLRPFCHRGACTIRPRPSSLLEVGGRGRSVSRDWFGDVIVVLFLVAQLLDFIFTYLGVAAFGVREGNPLLEHSMRAMGLGSQPRDRQARRGCRRLDAAPAVVPPTTRDLTVVYLALAILPWTWVLFVMN